MNSLTGESRWNRTFADLGYDWKPAIHWDTGIHVTYAGTAFGSSTFPDVSLTGYELELDWANSWKINERSRVTFGTLYAYQAGTSKYIFNGISGDRY